MDVINHCGPRVKIEGCVNTKKIERATAVPITTVRFGVPVLGFTGGWGADRHTQESPIASPLGVPPLPQGLRDGQKLLEYYPEASKRAHEQGRVVVKLVMSPSGALDLPMKIDRDLTDATPRLEEAAQKILRGTKFEPGENYKKNVSVSIVFELVPCGAVTHTPTTANHITFCPAQSPSSTCESAR